MQYYYCSLFVVTTLEKFKIVSTRGKKVGRMIPFCGIFNLPTPLHMSASSQAHTDMNHVQYLSHHVVGMLLTPLLYLAWVRPCGLQVIRCADAGADLVRITVQGKREALACKEIRKMLNARVRTDIQYCVRIVYR